jgi:ABC-type Zn uptake system ZnuABC Zn-binding protein ZnuA
VIPRPAKAFVAFAAIAVLLLAGFPAQGQNVRMVATTTDLASLARSVAGDLASVDVLISPGADPEAFEPRPSDLAKLKDAAIVIRVGLGYDHWLDKLLSLHGDKTIHRGGAGYVDASIGIPLLEVKGRSLDVTGNDSHAHGLANPHYWLDPANAEIITGAIVEAISAIAPQSAATIAENRNRFLATLATSIGDWESTLNPYRGAKLIAYHNTWPYFARRFRLDILDAIETKEGVPPSPARLAKLASAIREQKVHVILQEPFAPDDASQLLARRTGAALIRLASSVGSIPEAADYLSLFSYNVGTLARALSAGSN